MKEIICKAISLILMLMTCMSILLMAPMQVSATDVDSDYDYYDDMLDVSKATISPKSLYQMYYLDSGWGWGSNASMDISLKINGLAESLYYNDFSISSSNEDVIYVSSWNASVENNTIKFTAYAYNAGTAKITITLYGKNSTKKVLPSFKVSAARLSMTDGCLLQKGKTKQLKVLENGKKKTKAIVSWSSSNKKVASVSRTGKVKGKKQGNAIIYAKVGKNIKIGCAVAVTTGKKIKVIKKAKKIVKTCKYSQPKRMSSKYYDCSSLVWKAYRAGGIYIGSRSYAPTAANEAKYFSRKKKLKKFSYKAYRKAEYQVGDLCFRCGSKNGRFKNIYHVELVTGIYYDNYSGSIYYTGASGGIGEGGSGAYMARP